MVHKFVGRDAELNAELLCNRLRDNGWKSHVKHVGFEQYSVHGCPPHYLWSW